MKKAIAIFLILTVLLLTGCEEAWEDESEDNESEMHLVVLPKPGGGVQTVIIGAMLGGAFGFLLAAVLGEEDR